MFFSFWNVANLYKVVKDINITDKSIIKFMLFKVVYVSNVNDKDKLITIIRIIIMDNAIEYNFFLM